MEGGKQLVDVHLENLTNLRWSWRTTAIEGHCNFVSREIMGKRSLCENRSLEMVFETGDNADLIGLPLALKLIVVVFLALEHISGRKALSASLRTTILMSS